MAKLTEEAKKMIGDFGPAMIATASRSGKPNVSPKGSLRVVDDEHVVFADTRSPRTISNLQENPQVSIIVLDKATRKGCRIWGKAEIMSSGKLYDDISEQLAKRQVKTNHVVNVTIEDVVCF